MAIQTEWYPQFLIYGYFNQAEFWFDEDGNVHKIDELNPHYALNILCFLERLAPTIYSSVSEEDDIASAAKWLVNTPLYKKVKERVKENLKG